MQPIAVGVLGGADQIKVIPLGFICFTFSVIDLKDCNIEMLQSSSRHGKQFDLGGSSKVAPS